MTWTTWFSHNKRRNAQRLMAIESMETRVLLSAHGLKAHSNGPLPNYAGTWTFNVKTLGSNSVPMTQEGKSVTIDLTSVQPGVTSTANIKHDGSVTFKAKTVFEGAKARGTIRLQITGPTTLEGTLTWKIAGQPKQTLPLTGDLQP
ncbi:MAG: hypothetical protein U0903_13010 [Planctomycetales bacterium]